MPSVTVYKEVDVDIDLDDFDDDDLIDELETRGYKVFGKEEKSDRDGDIQDILWRFKSGYILDAAILLERKYPELYGLTKHIRS